MTKRLLTALIIYALFLGGCISITEASPTEVALHTALAEEISTQLYQSPTSTITSTPTRIPTKTPTPTLTVTNTLIQSQTATPTQTVSALIVQNLEAPITIFNDKFDYFSYTSDNGGSVEYNNPPGDITLEEGTTSDQYLPEEVIILQDGEGVFIQFQNAAQSFLSVRISSGEWDVEGFHELEFTIGLENLVTSTSFLGERDYKISPLFGTLSPLPDKTYNMLLAVGREGNIQILVWDPELPENKLMFSEQFSEDWAGQVWGFKMQATQGNATISEFTKLQFENILPQ